MEDSVFTNNGSSFGEGGGIYGYSSRITVRRSLFNGNVAEGGAAIYAGNQTLAGESPCETVVIEDSTFVDNLVNGNAGWSEHVGGAVGYAADKGSLTIRNSTIVGTKFAPTEPGGGAVRVEEGTARIHNTVLADNDPQLDDLGRGGSDVICGGRGTDKLKGGPGKDKLFGGPGKDVLIGGPGKDKLVGGPGRDTERQ